ncbi:Zinc finger CKR1 [Hyphodiscus hymeniophilus]|uniref:Zinc finger CKR1 n=1 Tax=Hyphodiscus hymeniophilus TaxID=353542 RepID=A0A9P6SM54_9HELO|nr:Zinc finger CKR1 [Hyphodiscus hymeniophilus]
MADQGNTMAGNMLPPNKHAQQYLWPGSDDNQFLSPLEYRQIRISKTLDSDHHSDLLHGTRTLAPACALLRALVTQLSEQGYNRSPQVTLLLNELNAWLARFDPSASLSQAPNINALSPRANHVLNSVDQAFTSDGQVTVVTPLGSNNYTTIHGHVPAIDGALHVLPNTNFTSDMAGGDGEMQYARLTGHSVQLPYSGLTNQAGLYYDAVLPQPFEQNASMGSLAANVGFDDDDFTNLVDFDPFFLPNQSIANDFSAAYSTDVASSPAVVLPMAAYTSATPAGPTPGNLSCPSCMHTFSRSSDLNRHSRVHDANARRYVCPTPTCSFSSLRRDKVTDHRRRKGH